MRTRDQQMRFGLGAAVFLAIMVTPALGSAQTEVSANVGWVSEYLYRGIPQKTSSGSVGLDIAGPNASFGTWAADVGDGNEVDLYASVGTEYEGFSVSVGGIGYFYTGGFDDTYLEGNVNAGYGALSVEYSIGTYRTYTDHGTSAPQSYSFLGITLGGGGFYATYGTFGGDFEGGYFETGYGLSVGDLDLSAAWVSSSRKLLGDAADNTIVIGVGHTIGIL